MNDLWDNEDEQEQATIARLKQMTADYWELKVKTDEAEKEFERLKKLREEMKAKVQELMQEEGLERFDGEQCWVGLYEDTYVTTPKSPEAKRQFFDWLQARGVFYDYASINHNSLQSLYKTEKAEGNEVPGIEPEKQRTKFKAYKKK